MNLKFRMLRTGTFFLCARSAAVCSVSLKFPQGAPVAYLIQQNFGSALLKPMTSGLFLTVNFEALPDCIVVQSRDEPRG